MQGLASPLAFPLALIGAYLIGSLSFAVIFSRLMGLADPRSYGSKNPGATNVLRSGNKAAAILTLVFDALKGYVPVLLVLIFGKPYGLAVGSNGHIFVVDGGSPSLKMSERGKVVELDATGNVIDTFGSHGDAPGQFQLGHDIAIGPDGAVYVGEGTGKRVQKFVRKQ